jgi:DNA-binding response OmpR family regulator
MSPSNTPHVLVVDDDPDIRDLVTEYLGKNDMRVRTAGSGREMFEHFEQESIDVQIRRLRLKLERNQSHPVLIVTEGGVGYRLASDVETLY